VPVDYCTSAIGENSSEALGDKASQEGQFNTRNSVVIDAKSNLYAASRQNTVPLIASTNLSGKITGEFGILAAR
jgi:hypothetical protein